MEMVAADWLRSVKREDNLAGRPGGIVQVWYTVVYFLQTQSHMHTHTHTHNNGKDFKQFDYIHPFQCSVQMQKAIRFEMKSLSL